MTPRALLCVSLACAPLLACGSDPAGTGTGDGVIIGADTGGGETGGNDAGTDAAQDTTPAPDSAQDDATPDTAPDAATDAAADAAPDIEDTAVDAASDASADAAEDVAEDVAPDAPADAAPDLPPGSVDPTRDGPSSVAQSEVRVPLSTGGDVAATLYVPQRLDDGLRIPVVVLSHGFQLSAGPYASYGRRLASHGIAALIPTYGDSLIRARTHAQLAEDVRTIIGWVEAQDATASSPLAGHVGPIGVSGHSRGGKQSIHAATLDDRIDAVFTLDPVDAGPPFGGNERDFPSVTPELMDSLTVPSGYIGAGRGAETSFPLAPACAPVDDNYHAYFVESVAPSFEYVLTQAGHLDFLDSCSGLACSGCPSGTNAEFTRDVSRATMTAFFKVVLDEDERYRPWVDGDAVDAWGAAGGLLTFTSR